MLQSSVRLLRLSEGMLESSVRLLRLTESAPNLSRHSLEPSEAMLYLEAVVLEFITDLLQLRTLLLWLTRCPLSFRSSLVRLASSLLRLKGAMLRFKRSTIHFKGLLLCFTRPCFGSKGSCFLVEGSWWLWPPAGVLLISGLWPKSTSHSLFRGRFCRVGIRVCSEGNETNHAEVAADLSGDDAGFHRPWGSAGQWGGSTRPSFWEKMTERKAGGPGRSREAQLLSLPSKS
jgi:hypothetical protein